MAPPQPLLRFLLLSLSALLLLYLGAGSGPAMGGRFYDNEHGGKLIQPWNKSGFVELGENTCNIKVPVNQKFPSVIKSDCNGRLGNQLSVYAAAWYFSQNFGMQPKLKEVQIAKIAEVFNRSKLQMDAVCQMENNLRKKPWKPLYEKDSNGYLSYETFHENPRKFRFNRLLDIGKCTNALHLFKENLPELRKQFQFKNNIMEAAQNALQQVKANFLTTKILFVGIHSRRGDYLLRKAHLARFDRIDGTYYNQAMAMFRFKYNRAGQLVVFIATSDDPSWLKANLRGANNDLFFSVDLFGGEMPGPGEDLAVRSLCNHSIIGAGTYGQWGALLAGDGDVVYPTGYGKIVTGVERTIGLANMSNWIALNISNFSILRR